MAKERYRVRSAALDTIAKKARATNDQVALEALSDVRTALKKITQENQRAAGKKEAANPLILGVGAAGLKEILDWLWDVGIESSHPILYEFLHLEPVDAGIMAIIAGFFVWVGKGR